MKVLEADALSLLYAIMEYVESSQWRCNGEEEHLERERVLYDKFQTVTGYRPLEHHVTNYRDEQHNHCVEGRWFELQGTCAGDVS